MNIKMIGERAKAASVVLAGLSSADKNNALSAMAKSLKEQQENILAANEKDVENAKKSGMAPVMLDRLLLTSERITGMCEGLYKLIALADPIGEVISMTKMGNGLLIGQKRVPLGVIGIIFESRPNVTVDAAALCLKAGNSVILRGGKEAINSNIALGFAMRAALKSLGLDEDFVQVVEDTDREVVNEMMKMNGLIDVLIPRGGAGLIKTVVGGATVPVIETGTGNCHIYVHETADIEMALNILHNAKTQRPSVCNSAESLIVDEPIAPKFLPLAHARLQDKKVEFRGCEKTCGLLKEAVMATQEDFYSEFLDYILSVKVVSGIEEAISHINRYSTGHSECIVTSDYESAQKFLDGVDSAAVYVNASTRFTDGFEFGLGAEIGISTQKMHARGPMGLKELTTLKYIIYGDGQIRN